MSKSSAVVKVLAVLALPLALAMVSPRNQPYYSPTAFGLFFTPLSVIYCGFSHLWLYGKARLNNSEELIQRVPQDPRSGRGKLAIVTGANTGIGYETARSLVVEHGWDVILACRSQKKALEAQHRINREVVDSPGRARVLDVPLDLAQEDSIQSFVAAFEAAYPDEKLDVIVNNAGRNTSGESDNNLDLLFRSNFLGHFVLTRLLLERLRGGRVVNLSSVMHHFCGSQSTETHDFWRKAMLKNEMVPNRYAASKLAAVLFSIEINRRYAESHQVRSFAVNPGGCSSDIWRDYPSWLVRLMGLFYLTPRQAAQPSVAAAVLPHPNTTLYIQPLWIPRLGEASPFPLFEMLAPYVGHAPSIPRLPSDGGEKSARALWEVSEELSRLAR